MVSIESNIINFAAMVLGTYTGGLLPSIDDPSGELYEQDALINWNALRKNQTTHTIQYALAAFVPCVLLYLFTVRVLHMNTTWFLFFGVAMSMGCLWHIFCDLFTVDGIPAGKMRLRIPVIRNKTTETLYRLIANGSFLTISALLWSEIR